MSTVLALDTSADLDNFVGLSAILTGIAAAQLQPHLDTHGTAPTYLALAQKNGGTTFTQLMSIYAANKTLPPAAITTLIMQNSGEEVAYMARSIILLWYLAAWYDPTTLPTLRQEPPPPPLPFTIVSSDAYTQSWVWKVGQTHPMGYSTWRFGYWHVNPPALSAFIGGSGQ